jgi:hypothetical protein
MVEIILLPPCVNANFRTALRQAACMLPTTMEFINRKTPPRLGSLLITPEATDSPDSTSTLAST